VDRHAIVENIGGGGSSLGAAAVARARPDGYTILLGGTLPHVNRMLHVACRISCDMDCPPARKSRQRVALGRRRGILKAIAARRHRATDDHIFYQFDKP
jgi:hypothetical protein